MPAPPYSPTPRVPSAPITGLREDQTYNAQRIVLDLTDKIHWVQPSAAPFVALSQKLRGSRTVENWTFWLLEKPKYPDYVTLAAGGDGNLTLTLIAGEGNRIPANMILRNVRTGELVSATTPAANTVIVTRAVDSTQIAMVGGDVLEFVGRAYADASLIGTIKSVAEVSVFNYCQIMRTPIGWSGRAVETAFYGGSDVTTETQAQMIEHKRLMEKAYFWGPRFWEVAANGYIRSTFGGVDHFIKNNYVWNLAGNVPSEDDFYVYLEDAMREGKGGYESSDGQKTLFMSARIGSSISKWARDKIQTETLDTVYGLKIRKLETPHGTINLVHSPALDEHNAGSAFLLDLNHIQPVTFQNRGTKLLKDREPNDSDSRQYEIFSDISLEVSIPEAHSKIIGWGV